MNAQARIFFALASMSCLVGCRDSQPDRNKLGANAYGWRAPIEISAQDSHYRLDLPPEFLQWMQANNVDSFSVLDSTQKEQLCGKAGLIVGDPIVTTRKETDVVVTSFSASTCAAGVEPEACTPSDVRGGQVFAIPNYIWNSTTLEITFSQPVNSNAIDLIGYDEKGASHKAKLMTNWGKKRSDNVLYVFFGTGAESVHSFRFIPPAQNPDLRIIQARLITYVPKPFVESWNPVYWFRAAGTPPYALYLQPGRSGSCILRQIDRGSLDVARWQKPNWPPAARVSLPVVNPRNFWNRYMGATDASRAWAYWIAVAGAVWLSAMAITLIGGFLLKSKTRQRGGH